MMSGCFHGRKQSILTVMSEAIVEESPPTWFVEALTHGPDVRATTVNGACISYRVWGTAGDPCVVLVHGGAAHAGWWDHVAPHLSNGHRVVAIDLSGHGESDHRAEYSLDIWAREVIEVAEQEGGDHPLVFGHSMGGFVALTAGIRYGTGLGGVAAIDSPVRETSAEAKAWIAEGAKLPGHKPRASRDEIIARFRTLPADESSLEYVRRHVAAASVREMADGWIWKFDPNIFFHTRMEPQDLAETPCPVALIRGERGMASRDITAAVSELLGGQVPVTVIPDAGHHIMFDQPIALIATLQTLAGQWASQSQCQPGEKRHD